MYTGGLALINRKSVLRYSITNNQTNNIGPLTGTRTMYCGVLWN